MRNNKKGFTIIELVIVIAVIAILAGVMIPTFSGIINKGKESAALQEATAAYHAVLGVTEYGTIDNGDDNKKDAYVILTDETSVIGADKKIESKYFADDKDKVTVYSIEKGEFSKKLTAQPDVLFYESTTGLTEETPGYFKASAVYADLSENEGGSIYVYYTFVPET